MSLLTNYQLTSEMFSSVPKLKMVLVDFDPDFCHIFGYILKENL